MKRLIAMLLALCCLAALSACGKEEVPGPADMELQSDAPETSPSADPSDVPVSDEPVNGDADMQLVWDIGDSVCPGFDTVMDRGTYTLAGVECRLFYFVKESRFAGEACVAPDGTVYVDLDGTLNWKLAEANGDGTYVLVDAAALATPEATPEVTDEPEESAEPTPSPSPEGSSVNISGSYAWPVDGYTIITFAYGAGHSDGRSHAGMDISGGDIAGEPVRAAADGIVNYIGSDPEGFGNFVTISHENGEVTFSLYAQMDSITVEQGDTVSAGEVIGYVGMSGSATGYHLHFGVYETWDWDSHFDPMELYDNVDVTYWE